MRYSSLIAMALAMPMVLAAPALNARQTTTSAPPTSFPPTIQSAVVSFQGQVQAVIKDYAQGADEQTTITDYSSTGRAFDFYLRNNFLPQGPSTCPQAGDPLPSQATTNDEAILYLQQTQLALISVSQDAINSDFEQGVYDFCQVIRLYGGAARNY